MSQMQGPRWPEVVRDLLEADLTKLVLSTLIILSVLPFEALQHQSLIFFALFTVEFALRVGLFRYELTQRRVNRAELAVLLFDLLAILSFLPLDRLFDFDPHNTRFLRLFRLTRMLMLLSYWRSVVREIWFILSKRERRYQLVFVASLVIILIFTAAICLSYFDSPSIDYNEDGNPHNESFWTALWWSFRQVQDPGNLLRAPAPSLAFVASLFLTLCGVVVFAFIIGIGASVVEELVQLGRKTRLGMRDHTVLANLGPHSRFLVDELVNYYRKSFRRPRIATLGPASARYDYLLVGALRQIRYRQGKPLARHDLERVDADRARRVILLGLDQQNRSDAQIVSQLLSVREVNPRCEIFAELRRSDSLQAALSAGGLHTTPIFAHRTVSRLLASLVIFPGLDRVYSQLLSSHGEEIYTCIFGRGLLANRSPADTADFSQLLGWSQHNHAVLLLGFLQAREEHMLQRLNPSDAALRNAAATGTLTGFVGISANFRRMKRAVVDLPGTLAARPADPVVPRFRAPAANCRTRRLLVCGDHEGLVEFCRQVLLFCPAATIVLMTPDRDRLETLRGAFIAHPEADDHVLGEQRVRFDDGGPDRLRCAVRGEGCGEATIELILGDCSDEQTLRDLPGASLTLRQIDSALLSYTEGDDDPDARTSLSLLKLLARERRDPESLGTLHVLCNIQSSEKAALLKRRFSDFGRSTDTALSLAITPSELLRNAFVAQGVFVPGICNVYEELLSNRGHEICRLEPIPSDSGPREITFGQLLQGVHHRDRRIIVAVELQDSDGAPLRVVINPEADSPDYRFKTNQLRGIYAIADLSQVSSAEVPAAQPAGDQSDESPGASR